MYWQKIFSSTLIALALLTGGAGLVQAAGVALPTASCPLGVLGCDATATSDLTAAGAAAMTTTVILKVLDSVLKFAALAAVLMLVVAGLRLVVAHGNQEELQAAHKHILWTLIGLVVIILSLLIVSNFTKLVFDAIPQSSATN